MSITLTLVLYLLLLLIVAYVSFKKINNYTDFFVAGKKGTTFLISGSLLATILGGSAVIGSIDAAPHLQWSISWFMICASIGLLAIIPFAGHIFKLGRFTLPDLLESMHGVAAKNIASFIIPFAWIGIIAAQIIASAKILDSFAGIPYNYGVIVSGCVFILYTLTGGQFSILKTDIFQAILVITGLSLVAIFAFRYNETSDIQIISKQTGLFHQNFSPFDLLILVATYATTFTTGPDIYSRLLCAKNQQTIKKSLIISALVLIPVAIIIGYIGVSATSLLPETTQGSLLVNLIQLLLPNWAVAIMVLALLSAVLSSADTTLLSTSVIVTDRLLKGRFKKRTLATTRLVILITGSLSVMLALNFNSIIDILLMALAIYAGAFTIPIIAGLLKIKFKQNHLSVAIFAGGITALTGKLIGFYTSTLTGNIILICAFICSGIILYTGRINHTMIDSKNENLG